MMRSVFSGVSGLKNHQTRMDVIGNNISNVNTTGFKSSRVTFADTLNQNLSGASAPKGDTLGGTNPKQIGLGSAVASVDLLFSDGTVQSTGKNTDLCLSGNGLFVVKNGNETYYTRDGAFEFDAEGNYVLPGSGLFVQGWNGVDGSINTNASATNIQVTAGKSMASKASTTITYANNLDASEETVAGISLSDAKGNVVSINASDTSTYVVGGDYSASINNSAVTFSNGISLPYATGSYAMQVNYAVRGSSTVTLANGDTISVPANSSATYRAGASLSGMSVNSVVTLATGSSKVNLSDKATITNDSGTEYTGTMTNGDTITIPVNTPSGDTFTKGQPLTSLNITSIDGKAATINLDSGAAINNVSNTTYIATLGNGDKVSIPSTATGNYISGGDYDGKKVTSVQGNKVTVNDGTTLENISGSTYTVTLASGNTIDIDSALSHKTYVDKSSLASLNLTVQSVVDATTYTLSDGSTLDTSATGDTFKPGDSINGQISKIEGLPTSAADKKITTLGTYSNTTNISMINLPTSAVASISGTITSGDASTDTFNTTSGYLKSSEGMTVNDIILTTDTGKVDVAGNDTTAYKTGEIYSSKISSVGLTMSDGTTSTQNSGSYTAGSSLPITTITTIYDTLGNAHQVTLFFTKTKVDSINGNQWTVSVAADGSGTSSIPEKDGSTTTVAMSDVTLQFDTTGKYSSGSGSTATMTLTNGATGTQTITVDLAALTQYAGNNTVNGNADGNAAGTLKSIAIDSSGIIRGTYTNGVVQDEAQVAVAQFTNASGLTKTGSSLYQASNNSGVANVKTAADLGVDITPSSLEMSNVDIANEFADMIITQRGFQSNSKMITVGDEMLETVINMKR